MTGYLSREFISREQKLGCLAIDATAQGFFVWRTAA